MITTLLIDGMLSVHSVRAVYTALGLVEGITSAEVQMGRAIVEHDGRATAQSLRDAVALAGCEVRMVSEETRRLPVRDDQGAH
jgi:copper chaperone CopZ